MCWSHARDQASEEPEVLSLLTLLFVTWPTPPHRSVMLWGYCWATSTFNFLLRFLSVLWPEDWPHHSKPSHVLQTHFMVFLTELWIILKYKDSVMFHFQCCDWRKEIFAQNVMVHCPFTQPHRSFVLSLTKKKKSIPRAWCFHINGSQKKCKYTITTSWFNL